MTSIQRIHIMGASGAGTTTLGRALAARLGWRLYDADDFFWLPTDPPFQQQRPVPERLALLQPELEQPGPWILSGAVVGWGASLLPLFDLVIFCAVPGPVRMARLMQRERERYGDLIVPGGPMHETHTAFIAWAAKYEEAGPEQRSRRLHDAWLATLSCPVLRLEGEESVEERVAQVLAYLTEQDAQAARTG